MNLNRPLATGAFAAAGLLSLIMPPASAADTATVKRPLMIQDTDIAKPGPPPHDGKGSSIGFPFSTVAGTKTLYFTKRVLHPGATVGRHLVDINEVYYLMAGEAELIDDTGSRQVKAGTAIFLAPGETIELRQHGDVDAVLIVAN
jgi:hypothetical protein